MNPITSRLFWLSLAFLVVNVSYSQSNLEETLARANKQFDLNAFNLALRTYEQVLKEQPNNAQALARSGDCYFYLNRPQEALGWYERALQSNPAPSEVMFRYGRALMHTGDYVGAKKWFVAYTAVNSTIGQHYAQMCDFALQMSRREGIYKVLNEPINTISSDFGPAFYGDQLVYSSSRNDLKRRTSTKSSSDWTGSAYNQLFVTRRGPDGYLQNPTFLRDDLQNTFNDGPVSFSANKRRVAFCRNSFMDGTRQVSEKGMSLSLYIAEVVEGKWINERAFPYNGSDYATGFPHLSADGNTLYFASDRPGGIGGWDLYVSTWNGSSWSTPKNLGAPINTPGNEITPFVDGDVLYFASDWHPGLGGFDIFRTELVEFGTPQVTHLGTGLNSSRDDYGFVFDAQSGIGYLTSNRPGGRGHEDIWQARKQVEEFVIEAVDEQRRPVPFAEIDFSTCNATAGTRQTDATGRYTFQTPASRANCQVTVRKEGYRPASVPIRTGGDRTLKVVLIRESAAARAVSSPFASGEQTPMTYSLTDDNIPVQMGAIERFSITVTDPNGRPVPGAEVNLTACELGVQRTDENGRAAFYYPAGSECNLVVRKDGYEDVFIALHQQAGRDLAARLKASNRIRYSGTVRDGNTNRPIADAQITARSRSDNHQTLALSDANGRYTLQLKPSQDYDIFFEKDGYQKGSVAVFTVAPDDNLSYTLLPARPAVYSATQPSSSPGMISIEDLGAAPSVTPSKPKKSTSPPAAKGEAFAIQLAANPEDFSASKLRRYSEFTSLGNLYTVREGNLYKLRLGAYPTREQADAVLAQISPSVKDAFVVRETQVNPEALVTEPPLTPSLAVKSPTAYSTTSSMPTPTPQKYAVQVASSGVDKPLRLNDYTHLSSIGNTYIRTENNFMHVRLGPWDTPTQAEAGRAEAARLGFPGAVVVIEKADNVPSAPASAAPPTAPNIYSTSSVTAPAVSVSAPPATKEYYVRVSAMENAGNFNTRQVEGLGGRLEKWPLPDGKMTAIMLTGFTDLEEAKRVTDRLRAGAFPDAYIIQNEQGKMSRYRY